jgi:hypothetical protein
VTGLGYGKTEGEIKDQFTLEKDVPKQVYLKQNWAIITYS